MIVLLLVSKKLQLSNSVICLSRVNVCWSAQDPLALLKQTTANDGKAFWLKKTWETGAKKTVQKHMGFMRSYYNWLRANQHVGASEVNPFHLDDIQWPKRLAEKQSYQPFAVSDVVRLRQAAQEIGDTVLLQYIDLAQCTGMRLAEIA